MASLDVLGVDGVANNDDNESKSRDQSGSGGNNGASAEGQLVVHLSHQVDQSHLNGMAAVGMELLLVLQMVM